MKDKNKKDSTWYAHIGALGGRVKGKLKGFAANRDLASRAGKIGGKSRKKPSVEETKDIDDIVKSLAEASKKS